MVLGTIKMELGNAWVSTNQLIISGFNFSPRKRRMFHGRLAFAAELFSDKL